MIRCSRCLMPETWAGITFDENGVCSLCREYDKQKEIDWDQRRNELIKILSTSAGEAIREGRKYAAICGYSGGKDTAFTIAYLTKEFVGIKVLAFTYDHGHPLLPEGEWNLNEFPKLLGVDHFRFTLGNPLRNAICRLGIEQIQDFCLPCHRGVGAGIVHMAKMLGIKLAIFGEPTALYSTTGTYTLDDREENDKKHFEDAFCGKLNVVPEGYDKADTWILNWPDGEVDLRSIYLGNYIPWRQRDNVKYIKNLGWKCPPATEDNPWPWNKLDCGFEVDRNWSKIIKGLGFDSFVFRLSIDIREGNLDREWAMSALDAHESKRPENMDAFCSDIGMTEGEFYALMAGKKAT